MTVSPITYKSTPVSNIKGIRIHVRNLTVFLAGAGMTGPYVDKMLNALKKAGISNVHRGNYSALVEGVDKHLHPAIDMLSDAIAVISYNQMPISSQSPLYPSPQFNGDINGYNQSIQTNEKNIHEEKLETITLKDLEVNEKIPNGQFNIIGYSWGAVIASKTALHYANQNIKIHHLVLIGAPIEKNLLDALQNHKNIGKVIIINLTQHGDPIYAGMADREILQSVPKLGAQAIDGSAGHFYYSSEQPDGDIRREELANRLRKEGLR